MEKEINERGKAFKATTGLERERTGDEKAERKEKSGEKAVRMVGEVADRLL